MHLVLLPLVVRVGLLVHLSVGPSVVAKCQVRTFMLPLAASHPPLYHGVTGG